MSKYKENPKEAVDKFNSFVETVSSCVSASEMEDTCSSIKSAQELADHHNSFLKKSLKEVVDLILGDLPLEEKLEELHELEKLHDQPAWRPKAGDKTLFLSLEGDSLNKKIEFLTARINEIQEKSASIQSSITDFRREIREKHENVLNERNS